MIKDDAVSAVVSELLLIVIVLIIIPSVTITLMNQLPEDRVPTVHIKMGPVENNTVTLYHKGGDYLVKDEIQILVSRNNDPVPVSLEYTPSDTSSYNLGDYVRIKGITTDLLPGDVVRVVAKNAIVFSGVVS